MAKKELFRLPNGEITEDKIEWADAWTQKGEELADLLPDDWYYSGGGESHFHFDRRRFWTREEKEKFGRDVDEDVYTHVDSFRIPASLALYLIGAINRGKGTWQTFYDHEKGTQATFFRRQKE